MRFLQGVVAGLLLNLFASLLFGSQIRPICDGSFTFQCSVTSFVIEHSLADNPYSEFSSEPTVNAYLEEYFQFFGEVFGETGELNVQLGRNSQFPDDVNRVARATVTLSDLPPGFQFGSLRFGGFGEWGLETPQGTFSDIRDRVEIRNLSGQLLHVFDTPFFPFQELQEASIPVNLLTLDTFGRTAQFEVFYVDDDGINNLPPPAVGRSRPPGKGVAISPWIIEDLPEPASQTTFTWALIAALALKRVWS